MKALSHTFAALMLMVHRTDAALMHCGGGGIVVMLIFLNVLALLSIGAERCSDICVDYRLSADTWAPASTFCFSNFAKSHHRSTMQLGVNIQYIV